LRFLVLLEESLLYKLGGGGRGRKKNQRLGFHLKGTGEQLGRGMRTCVTGDEQVLWS
jgi:hypothetical protein